VATADTLDLTPETVAILVRGPHAMSLAHQLATRRRPPHVAQQIAVIVLLPDQTLETMTEAQMLDAGWVRTRPT
jgi:hypothetical protein